MSEEVGTDDSIIHIRYDECPGEVSAKVQLEIDYFSTVSIDLRCVCEESQLIDFSIMVKGFCRQD